MMKSLIKSIFLFCLIFATAPPRAMAANDSIKLMLVLNSYDEQEAWANDMSEPISAHLSQIDSVDCDIVNLNNGMVVDSTIYKYVVDNVFSQYANNKPSYIVMVGSFAFTLRDRIKEEWGDIPMLLITKAPVFAPNEVYFTGNDYPICEEDFTPFEKVRFDYNFTTIRVPDYAEETIDLMMRLIPNMKELVYFSTNIFVARLTAHNLQKKLMHDYPGVQFKWLEASAENSQEMRRYFSHKRNDVGLLMSSWMYGKNSTLGHPIITASDMRRIASSKNPVFSLREAYRTYGTVGGVFPNNEDIHHSIRAVIDSMINGCEMRDIAFSTPGQPRPSINYRLLTNYNLSESACPPDTEFLVKPPTFFEQYLVHAIVVGIIVLFVIILMAILYAFQRKKIKRLQYTQFFLNNMPVPFSQANIQFDKNGKVMNIAYTKMNAAFEQIIENNKIEGNPFLLFPAEFISEKVEEMMHTKKNIAFTYQFDKTNTHYDFIICSVAEKNEKYGSLTVVDIFANDVTKRYEMENQIMQSAKKLDMAISVARVVPNTWNLQNDTILYEDRGMFTHSKSYRVTESDFDQGWEVPFDEFVTLIVPDDQEKILKMRSDLRSGAIDGVRNMPVRIHGLESEDGGVGWIEINNAVTERAPDGRPLIVTGAVRNITERKKMEMLLIDSLDKAKESDRMKSVFLANMSHEIRTPLNAIIGFSNLLASATDDAERQEFIEIINLNNSVLLSLVNDALDFAKIEANTMEMRYVATDLNEVLESAAKSVKMRVPEGVTLSVHNGMDKCVVEAASVRISQVLGNFLTNACKFTAQGSIDMGYELRNDGKTLYLYVRDTGIGIKDEDKEKVFDRFVKLNSFAQGTGLGLAICSRLVELMGGEIGVDSEGEGKGSTFWFTLPYKPCEESDRANENEKSDKIIPINHAATYQPKHSGKPLMLIAEDNVSNYKLIAHMLKDDYMLVRAANGIEAVEIFKQRNPDIVLMDIGMPLMDGYEATRRIREVSKSVPIIAVTAYSYDSDRRRILSSGFNAFVSKPVASEDLMEAIAKVTAQAM